MAFLPQAEIYANDHHKLLDTTDRPLPKVVVLDLDYTLWPCWCDTHVATPVRGLAMDSTNRPSKPSDLLLNSKDTKRYLRQTKKSAKAALKLASTNPNKSTTSSSPIYGSILDSDNNIWEFYPDVPAILDFLNYKQIKIITASRTCTPKLAEKMLKLLHVPRLHNHHHRHHSHTNPNPNHNHNHNHNHHHNHDSSFDNNEIEIEIDEKEETKNVSPDDGSVLFVPAWDLIDHSEWGTGTKITHFQNLQRHLCDNHNNKQWNYNDMIFFDDEYRNIDVQHNLGVVFNLVTEDRGLDWNELMRAVETWWKLNGY